MTNRALLGVLKRGGFESSVVFEGIGAVSNADVAASGTQTPAWPAGEPTSGHTAICFLFKENADGITTDPPTGWTTVGHAVDSTFVEAWAFKRDLVGSDSAPALINASVFPRQMVSAILVYSGVSSVLDTSANTIGQEITDANRDSHTGTITSTNGGVFLTSIMHDVSFGEAIDPTGFTERLDEQNLGNDWCGVAEKQTASGTVPVAVWDIVWDASLVSSVQIPVFLEGTS